MLITNDATWGRRFHFEKTVKDKNVAKLFNLSLPWCEQVPYMFFSELGILVGNFLSFKFTTKSPEYKHREVTHAIQDN